MTLDEARTGIGRWVVYRFADEIGRITGVRDGWVLVLWEGNQAPEETAPGHIEWPVVVRGHG